MEETKKKKSKHHLLTLDRPTFGKVSKDSLSSSPVLLFNCPLRILAAVTVDTPIPSPRNKITFLATAILGLFCLARFNSSRAILFQ